MTIDTKYSIDDVVYMMLNNKITWFTIKSLVIHKQEYYDSQYLSQNTLYSADIYGKKDFFEEALLFSSMTDLIDSLKENTNEKRK